jgi:hypothetical protein
MSPGRPRRRGARLSLQPHVTCGVAPGSADGAVGALPQHIWQFGNPWIRPVSSGTSLPLPGFEAWIFLEFLGFSRQNLYFSMSYWPCAPGKKYCALLPEATQSNSVKRRVPPAITHALMTRIVAGIRIFSKKMVICNILPSTDIGAENSPGANPRSPDALIALAGVVRVGGGERDRQAGGGPASHRQRHKKNQQATHRRLRISRRGLTFPEGRRPMFRWFWVSHDPARSAVSGVTPRETRTTLGPAALW